ncbi:hypothetical protein VNO78_15232 [Psophocarpus tetragonolobus]|uniref:RING-type domain-containing protein n=1 Tax=Psophocarpus tetragonolobus TaxID=3891 RepID=A0AAN9SJC6_PSOTE
MSTPSQSPSPSIPMSLSLSPSKNDLDLFTKLFLFFLFLSLFVRVCYVFVSTRRDQQDNNNSVNSNNNTSTTRDDDEEQNHHPSGLPIHVLNSYHTFPYTKTNVAAMCDHNTTCSICIEEYEDSDMLRIMPLCRHYFHRDCVDAWLKVHSSCPVCRNSLLEAIHINNGATMERV